MKKVFLFLFSLITIVSAKAQQAYHPYEITYDSSYGKILKGLLSRSDIESDTSFAWFQKNYKLGRPDAKAVAAFKQHAGDFKMLIFAGTWCPDTHNLLPEFYRLTDAAGYPDNNISIIGVDYNKTTFDNLEKTFNVTEVPTFIVMKDGKEVGRIVEYGESGEAMKELGKMVEGL
jgi:thiol-disulfide isomerase/thioredoxin